MTFSRGESGPRSSLLGRRRRTIRALVGVSAVIAFGGCGAGAGGAGDPSAAQPASPPKAASTAGLPPALAANVRDADRIVGEGEAALQQRLAALRGHPVVLNQWASWCTSCRFEFPFFRSAAARHRERVAFLGLDSRDARANAEDFLREMPVGFPSVFDPDATLAASFGAGSAWPTTVFLDERGERVHVKIGAYANEQQLEDDIRRHALRG